MSDQLAAWSDAELVGAAVSGDSAAANTLFARFEPYIKRVATQCTSSPDEAREAAAAGRAAAFEKLESLRNPDRFGAWIATIVKRAAVDAHRRALKESPTDDLESEPTPADGIGEESSDDDAERLERARRALFRLGDRDRRAIELAVFDELPVARIAAELMLDTNTAYQVVSRARKRLRRLYLTPVVPPGAPQACVDCCRKMPDYVRGDPKAKASVASHVDGCSGCQARLAEALVAAQEVRGLWGLTPFLLVGRALRGVGRRLRHGRLGAATGHPIAAGLTATLLAAGAIGGYHFLRTEPARTSSALPKGNQVVRPARTGPAASSQPPSSVGPAVRNRTVTPEPDGAEALTTTTTATTAAPESAALTTTTSAPTTPPASTPSTSTPSTSTPSTSTSTTSTSTTSTSTTSTSTTSTTSTSTTSTSTTSTSTTTTLPVPPHHSGILLTGNGTTGDSYGSAGATWVGSPQYGPGPRTGSEAFDFDGTNGLVDDDIPGLGEADFTLQFDVATSGGRPATRYLVGYGGPYPSGTAVAVLLTDGSQWGTDGIVVVLRSETDTPIVLMDDSVPVGDWDAIRISRMGPEVTLSVDGVVEASAGEAGDYGTVAVGPWRIGHGWPVSHVYPGPQGSQVRIADLYVGPSSTAPALDG